MSFINNRLFKNRPKSRRKKKNNYGKMKVASSFADPRAWCLDPRTRMSYLLDSMADVGSSSGGEDSAKEIQPETINIDDYPIAQTDIIPIRGSYSTGRLLDDTDNQVTKLSNKLFEAKDQIEELKSANEILMNEKKIGTEEMNNLRRLVTNMKEQLECLQSIRSSFFNSHSETAIDEEQLEEAQVEIRHLRRKIEIYDRLRERHSKVLRVYDDLIEEKSGLVKAINELRIEKAELLDSLNSKEKALVDLSKKLTASKEFSVEKDVLRDRVAQREEKIRDLEKIVSSQDVSLVELKAELSASNKNFTEKEISLNREIDNLRKALGDKCDSITELEEKLHATALLVAELETLRDQFRNNNLKLTESVRSYEKEVEEAAGNLEELLKCIAKLKEENLEKQKEIDKLTLFPQNPETMLYFSHLNKLVVSAGNVDALSQGRQTELLGSIKTVVQRLREEMWGGNFTPMELSIEDKPVQTEIERNDFIVQIEPNSRSVVIQTDLPDEYAQKIVENLRRFEKLHLKITKSENTLSELVGNFDSLETELFGCIEDNYSKDRELENSNVNNSELTKIVTNMSQELIENDRMLKEAMTEIIRQVESHNYLRSLADITMESSTNEYNNYITVLEATLWYKERQIEQCECTIKEQEARHTTEIEGLLREIDHVKLNAAKDKIESTELKDELKNLYTKLKETKKLLRRMEIEAKRKENLMGSFFTNGHLGDVGLIERPVENCLRSNKSVKSDLTKSTDNSDLRNKRARKIKRQIRKTMEICKKGKLVEMRLKEEILTKENEKCEVMEKLKLMSSEKSILLEERNALVQQSLNAKTQMRDMEKRISSYEEKMIAHEELKMKMEKMVLKLMKRIARYKNALNTKRSDDEMSRSYFSEKLTYEIDLLKNENANLYETICGLKQKLSSLLELPQSSSVELQVSFEENPEKEEVVRTNSKSYCDKIAILKHEYEIAADESYKNYANNLKTLKESYERDIVALKKSHAENLEKMQLLQREELTFLSRRQNQAALDDQKSHLERDFERVKDELRNQFLLMLKEKEESFETEKIELEGKIGNMESELLLLKRKCSEEINSITASYETRINEIQELYSIKEKDLTNSWESRIANEIQNQIIRRREQSEAKGIQCSQVLEDIGTDPSSDINHREAACNTEITSLCVSHRITDINYHERISCEVKAEDPNKVVVNVVQSLSSTDDTTVVSQVGQFLSQIEELEKRLQAQQTESARKMRLYEKKIKHEQMKAKEIANILEQELKYSTDVHCKLGLQFNRAEQLELEKKALTAELMLSRQNLPAPRIVHDNRAISEYEEPTVDFECSFELEQSLNRLKEKIDQAADQGRKLSCEMWKKRPDEKLLPRNLALASNHESMNVIDETPQKIKMADLLQRRYIRKLNTVRLSSETNISEIIGEY